MVLGTFKENVVVEKGWATMKQIKKFVMRLALLIIELALGVALITLTTVGKLVTFAVFIIFGLIYVWLIDIADEDEQTLKNLMKVSKFWVLGIFFDIAVFAILKLTMFL